MELLHRSYTLCRKYIGWILGTADLTIEVATQVQQKWDNKVQHSFKTQGNISFLHYHCNFERMLLN